ncbi:MAG: EAL domain-containing protein, partial [Gaiellaceae bacterium MAG52_C11]|nr:EAL domain-containing protein [Candidatus Gaiellasilicea maunaloa]
LAGLQRFRETGESRVLGERLELTALHRDGHELPVEMTISPLRTDDGWQFNAFIQDISERHAAESELRSREARFRALATQSPGGIYETDAGGGLTFASRRWCEMAGLTQAEANGHGWLDAIHPDDLNGVVQEWMDAAREDRDFEREYRLLHADGAVRWVYGTATPVRSEGGEITGFLGACLDITERRRGEAARAAAEARFRSAFNQAPIGMAMNDLDGRFTEVNSALVEMTGYPAEELRQMSFEAITHPDDVVADREGRRALLSGEIPAFSMEKRYVHAGGHPVWVGISVAAVCGLDGRPLHTLTQVQDITDRRNYERKLQHMADHDPLTGLLNRRSFDRELQGHVERSSRYGAEGALLVLDVDHLKHVNDTLGHNVGDELIVRVGNAVRDSLRSSDVVARLGGDEFAVLLPKADREAAAKVAASLCERIRREELTLTGRSRPLSASVGVALLADAPDVTAEDLLANADLAMYDAKEDGRDRFALYSSEGHHEARMKGRVRWVERIRRALEDETFTLLAQPVVDLATGRPSQYELLLRMRDSDGDLIPPGAFLYIAERLDMVQEIDRWVTGQAIDLMAERERAGAPVTLEVNLSGRSMGDPRLLESIEHRLAATGVDASNLILEVTETAAVTNIAAARAFAERLSELGCRFALDDFGAGFGSFYYLKHLPFDLLKIDGEFIRNCLTTQTDRLVISAVVDIARGLGKQTVAEFVGDDETARLLTRLGVDYAQGYHLGKPVAVDDALLTPRSVLARSTTALRASR